MDRKRILIVDDESLIRWSLWKRLSREDYDVELAEDPFEALRLVRSQVFALVITDLRMDALDGLRLAQTIREISPGTKVIIISAYGSHEIKERARALGVETFIDKPFDMDQVCAIVHRELSDVAAPN